MFISPIRDKMNKEVFEIAPKRYSIVTAITIIIEVNIE